jgi:signal transduction histidine kinase
VLRNVLPATAASQPSLIAYEAALCATAGLLLTGLLWAGGDPAEVTDLVVELGDGPSRTLRDRLSRALADPTLELGYTLPGEDGLVDGEGRPLTLPAAGADRAVTVVERDGAPWLTLLHDPALVDDVRLRRGLTAAAELAAANAHLMADVRAQIRELEASRERILRARDAERVALARRLHAGAAQRLERLASQLADVRQRTTSRTAGERVDRAASQLDRTLDELDRLSRGLLPGDLASAGLHGALSALAERMPIPVAMELPPSTLPTAIEATVYFVCSEALANIAKHASASRATVSVTTEAASARVAVTDDGVGGADSGLGTGLRGLADRVEALGGRIRLESARGRGTCLVAEIPFSHASSTSGRSPRRS